MNEAPYWHLRSRKKMTRNSRTGGCIGMVRSVAPPTLISTPPSVTRTLYDNARSSCKTQRSDGHLEGSPFTVQASFGRTAENIIAVYRTPVYPPHAYS